MASGNVGIWSDIYALCATMYYTLSGQAPSSAIDRLQQRETISFPNISDIPRYLTAVIERGLALQPSDRYKTLEDLIYALEHPEALENNHTIMKTIPKNRHAHSLLSHSIRLWLLGAGVIISLLGAAYAFRTLPFHTASAPKMTATTATPTPDATLTPSPIPTAPAILRMENVTGLSQKNAKKKIHALDSSMKILIQKKYDRSHAKGRVIAQSIAKGTLFNAGSLTQITLTISRGARPASLNTQTPDSTQTVKPATAKPVTTPKPTKKNANDFEVDSKRKSSSFEID